MDIHEKHIKRVGRPKKTEPRAECKEEAGNLAGEHDDCMYWDSGNSGNGQVDPNAFGWNRTGYVRYPMNRPPTRSVVYSVNPKVKFYVRNGRYYWTIKSEGFDTLEQAFSDAEGFSMSDLTIDEITRDLKGEL